MVFMIGSIPKEKQKIKRFEEVDAYANEFSISKKITIEEFLMKKKDKIKIE